MWTADELTRVRADLLAQLRELEHVEVDGGPGQPAGGEDSGEPETDDSTEAEELAARSAEEDVAYRVRAVEGHLRAEVADALARLDQGRYGVCERCGNKVSKERLRALPHARWCMPCARRANSAG